MPVRDTVKRVWAKMANKSTDLAPIAPQPSVDNTPSEIETRGRRDLNGGSRYRRSNLNFVRTIGTGSFGRVFAAETKEGDLVAVKRLVKSSLIRQKQVEHVKAEKKILTQFRYPFIVNILNSFQDESYLYIVMELVRGGEFFTYLRKIKRLSLEPARFYAATVTLIFEFLHGYQIVYRDLKPENLLLTESGYLKLTDFGFAKKVETRTYTLCGTPEYIAPEVLLNKGHGTAVDWWTLGILIYEMLAGYPPFYDEDVLQIYQKILAGRIMFPRIFDRNSKDLIKGLLQHDLSRRLGNLANGARDVIEDPWFTDFDWTALKSMRMSAPYVPPVQGETDLSQFQKYAESKETPIPVASSGDPFLDW